MNTVIILTPPRTHPEMITEMLREVRCRECQAFAWAGTMNNGYCARCVCVMTDDGRWCRSCSAPMHPDAACLGCRGDAR